MERFEAAAIGLLAIASVAFLFRLLAIANRGIDFTDEGYYLAWISNPWVFKGEVTQFGYIYHPIYRLVKGDITLLRQLNILAIFLLSGVLAQAALFRFFQSGIMLSKLYWVTMISLAVACTSLMFFQVWIPTPSYNSLAFQALLIAGIGLLLVDAKVSGWRIFGWQAVGLAVYLAFMAKPTTAVALIFVAGLYFLRRPRAYLLPAALACCTAIAFILMYGSFVHGSVAAFFAELNEGASFARRIGGPASYSFGTIVRLDIRTPSAGIALLTISICIVLTLALLLSLSHFRWLFIGLTAAATLAVLALSVTVGSVEIMPSKYFALEILAVPAAVVALLVIARWRKKPVWLADTWALSLCFFAFPFVYTFGTMSNYWASAASAGLFWVIGSILLLRSYPGFLRGLLPIAAYGQILTFVVLLISLQYPYRQSHALVMQTEPITLPSGAQLLLSSDVADYVKRLIADAGNNGFRHGDQITDLTGQYPGTLYLMGATPVGRAWMIGGYVGSTDIAKRALERAGCRQIAGSWLLMEPNGTRSLPASILDKFGIDPETDYTIASTVRPPDPDAGPAIRQLLLRPSRTIDEATSICEDRSRVQKDINQGP